MLNLYSQQNNNRQNIFSRDKETTSKNHFVRLKQRSVGVAEGLEGWDGGGVGRLRDKKIYILRWKVIHSKKERLYIEIN